MFCYSLSDFLFFWCCGSHVIVLQAGPSVEQMCGDGEANQRDKHSPMLGVRHLCMSRVAFDCTSHFVSGHFCSVSRQDAFEKCCFLFLHGILDFLQLLSERERKRDQDIELLSLKYIRKYVILQEMHNSY